MACALTCVGCSTNVSLESDSSGAGSSGQLGSFLYGTLAISDLDYYVPLKEVGVFALRAPVTYDVHNGPEEFLALIEEGDLNLVATDITNDDGFYVVSVPPGDYSVGFVYVYGNDLLLSTTCFIDNLWCSHEVRPGEKTEASFNN